MSLKPIRSRRRGRRQFAELRAREQWKPWAGWTWKKASNRLLEHFGNKRFVLGIVAIAIIIGGTVLAQGSLFHSYETCSKDPMDWGPGYCGDPVTTIWKATAPDNSLSEFNTVRAIFGAIPAIIDLLPNGTQTAVALTKSPIGDLGIAAAKQLFYRAQYKVGGTCCGGGTSANSYGFYLTTNKTLPTELGYDPFNDRSVSMLVRIYGSGVGTFSNTLFMQRNPGDTIASQDHGCFASGSCFAGVSDTIDPTLNNVTLGGVLNYTTQGNISGGCIGSVGGPGCSELAIGPGTTVPPTVNAWSQNVPWFRFQGEQYYAGFYSLGANTGFDVQFFYERTSGGIFNPNDVAYYVPGPNCSGQSNGPCNPDTGGFFGPVIKALISIGIFIFNGILAFVGFILPALQTALSILETAIKIILNVIGNALGFGNVGDNLFTVLNGIISFMTNNIYGIPAAFSNFAAPIARFLDSLNVYFQWVPNVLLIASNLTLLAVNSIGFILTIVRIGFQLIAGVFVMILLMFFLIYTADDALGGLLAFVEFFKWLVFGLGLKLLVTLVNFGLDVVTYLIGLIPKPFIQMVAHSIPRIPFLDVQASFVNPSFDFGEMLAGNLFSVWCWMIAFVFFALYTGTSPPLPGSIGAQPFLSLPAGFYTTIQSLTQLLEISFLILSGIVFIIWPIQRGLTFFMGVPSLITIGPGRKISSGGGGISIRAAGKRFQGKAKKQKEQQEKFEEKTQKDIEKQKRKIEEEKAKKELREREIARKPTGKDIKGPRHGPF